jgi:FkbM family methyltransferase
MTWITFKKKIRYYSARLSVLRPLRSLVFRMRGGSGIEGELDFFSCFVNNKSHVFDVGANRGQSSEVFTKLGARVTAFEPQADLHPEISQLCGKNARLKIESCALGNVEETRFLHITTYDQVASLRDDWEGEKIGKMTVQISTLDRQIEIHGLPDYCKIDVEGWELEVLSGLTKQIPIISFEYHNTEAELERAISVLHRISELGEYWCNIRTSSQHGLLLDQFVTLRDFISKFKDIVTKPTLPGYGDVFCILHLDLMSQNN